MITVITRCEGKARWAAWLLDEPEFVCHGDTELMAKAILLECLYPTRGLSESQARSMIPNFSIPKSPAIEPGNFQPVELQCGNIVAWFDGQSVFAPDGRAIGFVRGRGLFSPQGDLQGYFQGSAFRDQQGKVVATTQPVKQQRSQPPVCIPMDTAKVLTDWPPQVPSLDQWSTKWREVFR